jgi:hypothetical protein
MSRGNQRAKKMPRQGRKKSAGTYSGELGDGGAEQEQGGYAADGKQEKNHKSADEKRYSEEQIFKFKLTGHKAASDG